MDRKTLVLLLVVFIDLIGFGIVIPILPLLITRNVGGAMATINLSVPFVMSGIMTVGILMFGKKYLRLIQTARKS